MEKETKAYNTHRTLGMQAFYRNFKKNTTNRFLKNMKQSMYTEILYRIFNKIFQKIMTDAYKYYMRKVGLFYLIKYLPETAINSKGKVITNNCVDPVKTKIEQDRTGDKSVRVYFDNSATGGYIYRFIWDRARIINLHYFRFKGREAHRKTLHDEILNGNVVAHLINFKLKVT